MIRFDLFPLPIFVQYIIFISSTLNHTTQVRIRHRLIILGGRNMRGWDVFIGLCVARFDRIRTISDEHAHDALDSKRVCERWCSVSHVCFHGTTIFFVPNGWFIPGSFLDRRSWDSHGVKDPRIGEMFQCALTPLARVTATMVARNSRDVHGANSPPLVRRQTEYGALLGVVRAV